MVFFCNFVAIFFIGKIFLLEKMKKTVFVIAVLLATLTVQARTEKFGKGQLTVTTVAHNAVRIQYCEEEAKDVLPD